MEFNLIILFIFMATTTEGRFFVSTLTSGPFDVNCTLAKPSFSYDGDLIMVSLRNITISKPVWVGYYQVLAGFEYSGCARKDTTLLNEKVSGTYYAKEDPGSCFHYCNSFFGIKKRKCYCLNDYTDNVSFTDNGCNHKCNKKSGVACGSDDYISIYKMNSEAVLPEHPTDEHCAIFEPTRRLLQWKRCLSAFLPMCLNKTTIYALNHFESWMESAQRCFNLKSRPTTYNESKQISIRNGSQLWTGLISSETIFNFEGISGIRKPGMKMGTLTYNVTKRKFILDFLDLTTNANTELQSLCDEAGISEATTESTTTLETTTDEMTQPETTNAEQSDTQTSNTNDVKNTTTNAGVGLPVGVTVAVVVIIVVAVTVLVVVRRRNRKTPDNNTEMNKGIMRKELPNDYTEIPEISHAKGNSPLRYLKVEGQDNYAHTYHVLEKDHKINSETNAKHNNNPQIESHYNYPDMSDLMQEKIKTLPADVDVGQYAHTYFVLEEHQKDVDSADGTYNVTGAHKPNADQETDNVYNKLDDKKNGIYDHLRNNLHGSDTTKRETENMHDSKENAMSVLVSGGKPDSVYNHVSGVEESGTYDHVSNVVSDAKGADNTYGVRVES